jgi:hypothetical protein
MSPIFAQKYLTNPSAAMRAGDEVVVRQVPPISKHKAHRLEKILRSPEAERDAVLAAQAAAKRAAAEAQGVSPATTTV